MLKVSKKSLLLEVGLISESFAMQIIMPFMIFFFCLGHCLESMLVAAQIREINTLLAKPNWWLTQTAYFGFNHRGCFMLSLPWLSHSFLHPHIQVIGRSFPLLSHNFSCFFFLTARFQNPCNDGHCTHWYYLGKKLQPTECALCTRFKQVFRQSEIFVAEWCSFSSNNSEQPPNWALLTFNPSGGVHKEEEKTQRFNDDFFLF